MAHVSEQQEDEDSNLPIDRGWAWVIVVATGFSGFCMIGIAKSFGVLADEMKDYFDAPQYMVAMVMGVSALVYTIAAPVSLILGEHFTPRQVVIVGGIVGSIGIAVSSLCFSLVYLICTFGIFFGIGNGFLYGNCLVMVGKYFRKRRSLANGLALSGGSIGQFALPPLIQFFINFYTLRGALLVLGGIYFNVAGFGALLRPLTFYQRKSRRQQPDDLIQKQQKIEFRCSNFDEYSLEVIPPQDATVTPSSENVPLNAFTPNVDQNGDPYHDLTPGKSAGAAVDKNCLLNGSIHDQDEGNAEALPTKGDKLGEFAGGENVMSASVLSLPRGEQTTGVSCPCCRSWKIPKIFDFSVLKNRKCLLYCFVMFFIFFGSFNFIMFLPSIAKIRGIPDYQKAYLVSICGVSDLIGRLSCGFFSDFNIIQRYKIMIGCSLVLGVDMLIFVWAHTYWQMAIQSAIYGLAGGGYVMLVSIVLIDFVGLPLLPKALAVVLFLQGIGGAIGQVFLGWIRDMSGNFDMVMIICGISCSIGGLALILYPIAKKWEAERLDKIPKLPRSQKDEEIALNQSSNDIS